MQESLELHRTADLYYASFLMAADVPFYKTEREGRRVYFLFERVEGLEELKRAYFNGRAKVSARKFVSAIRHMKTLTHMDK